MDVSLDNISPPLDLINLLLTKGAKVPQDNKDKREEIALKIKKANQEQSEQNIVQ